MTRFGYMTVLYILNFAGFLFFAAMMLGTSEPLTAGVAFGLSQVCVIACVFCWLGARRGWKNRSTRRKL
jgi:quinol-cytochrome oxidoreductase complex cytochrome b subunit